MAERFELDDMMEENEQMEQQVVETEDIPVDRLSDSSFFRMYLNEVRGKQVVTSEEQLGLYRQLLAGDQSVSETITNSWLMRIIEMAKFYKDTPVNMEDVIQEGNMGLWIALSQMPESMKAEDVDSYLVTKVRESMENYIREITGDADQVQAIVGKAALLYEAQEILAEENGEVPSLRQLSEYTHIPVEEIQDIFTLMKEEQEN